MRPDFQVFLMVVVGSLALIFGGSFIVWVFRALSGDKKRRRVWTDEEREYFRRHGVQLKE